jgi:hemerythrin-like domain-containing protein
MEKTPTAAASNPTSGLPGFPLAAASFEAPLEMLVACHERIRRQCATLLRLRSHVAAHGADAEGGSAARGVIRYFDRAARDHHEDEEHDLFPALVESVAGSDPVCIRQLTDSLAADHRELERLWAPVRAWLVAVEGGAAPPDTDPIDAFVELYERHAVREEQELLPMASRLLGPQELDRIGRSMRLRRGITSD